MDPSINIRPFQASDQNAVRRLILEGLGEHFGFIDERVNVDLDDIAATYAKASFLVACDGGRIVATGALVADSGGAARIVRMSCAKSYRRRGIGSALIARLILRARDSGSRRIVLATNDDWNDANGFYRALGFTEIARVPGGIAYELNMD